MRQSYIVIVADHPGERVWMEPSHRVAFAQLNDEGLSIVVSRIAPAILGLDAQERLRVVRKLFRAFAKGIFPTSLTCACSIQSGSCASCSCGAHSRFLWENGYSRILPYGKDHWYFGLSDAVTDDSEDNGWLPTRCLNLTMV
jgi:hypothetical protein